MRQLVRSGEGGLGVLGGLPQLPPPLAGPVMPAPWFLKGRGWTVPVLHQRMTLVTRSGLSFQRSSFELLDSTRDSPGGTPSLVTIKDTQRWWQVGKHGVHLLPNHRALGSTLKSSGSLRGT